LVTTDAARTTCVNGGWEDTTEVSWLTRGFRRGNGVRGPRESVEKEECASRSECVTRRKEEEE
jgi:hypothetical protein